MKFILYSIIFQLYLIENSYQLKGPKESKIWSKRQSQIPIINPLELDSPYIQGMGHEMLESLEKISLEDTNMGTNPVFPMRDGYDVGELLGDVGKILPLKIKQWGIAQKGRIPYVVKIGQNIGSKIKANIMASIPSLSLPEKSNIKADFGKDNALKTGDQIDFQVEKGNIKKPVTNSNSKNAFMNSIKEKATETIDKAKNLAKETVNNLKNDLLGDNNEKTAFTESEKIEFQTSLNK